MVGCHWAAISGYFVARSLKPGSTFLLAQYGQPPLRWVRVETTAWYSCPLSQIHQTLRLLAGAIWSGVRVPFLLGCHSLAMAGYWLARSFSPGMIFLPAQTGQPLPWARLEIMAWYSWPLGQIHQTLRRLPGTTSFGVRAPFFVGCHSLARVGSWVARSLSPLCTVLLVQTGQPAPLTRDFTCARH